MHIVIVGMGEVGRHLLGVLESEGHDLVAIDQNPDSIAYVEDHHDVATLIGYGASHDVLDQAQVRKADLVVAVTDHDEVNLIAALAAKQLGAGRVIARAQGNAWTAHQEGVRYGLLGVDVVINPRVLVAQELTRIARSHGAVDVIDLAQDRIELVQLELGAEAKQVGKPLMKLNLPRDTLIAALVREGRLVVPGGADVLMPGDRVYMIGRPDAILQAEDHFTSKREARRVCIVGGGVVGRALARNLAADDTQVLVIEQDRERAEKLSVEVPRATIVHGDGTNRQLLEEEEVGTYDLVCSVTSEDEVNLMAALLAQRIGQGRTAALVHRGDYMPIYKQLGVDIVLTPRAVASDQIIRYCRGGGVQNLTSLEDGQAEVAELRVPRGARVVGVPLRRMGLPRGALLAGIVHEDQVIIPRGDDVVHAGDTVILLLTESSRPIVERMFRARRG
ncbi:MAG TPA: Trk system potassium transporter TrkA [Sandaracinaceae bacterium LLY-WYZ-13_1]|nr:Trk system potassium transporter TrkA [Sandaracinaceae bacterium LLY-WYZ-13_1]